MAVPDWQTDIPTVPYSPLVDEFQVASFGLEPDSTDMQAGNVRMRNLYSVDISQEHFVRKMTQAQLDTFLTWVRDVLGRGTSKFTMPIPKGTTHVVRTCQIINGMNGIQASPFGWEGGQCVWRVEFNRRVENYLGT
jgi:hypothetical protein